MHHGTCVTHVPWCMLGSITRSDGEIVPGIPGACATPNFTYLLRGPYMRTGLLRFMLSWVLEKSKGAFSHVARGYFIGTGTIIYIRWCQGAIIDVGKLCQWISNYNKHTTRKDACKYFSSAVANISSHIHLHLAAPLYDYAIAILGAKPHFTQLIDYATAAYTGWTLQGNMPQPGYEEHKWLKWPRSFSA